MKTYILLTTLFVLNAFFVEVNAQQAFCLCKQLNTTTCMPTTNFQSSYNSSCNNFCTSMAGRTNEGDDRGYSSATCNTPLPVVLIDFFATVENNEVRLNWITASENNNKGFVIERSLHANDFESIGFEDGKGNASDLQHYTFKDSVSKLDFVSYYRLKQLDYDGNYTYSKVIKVFQAKDLITLGALYPNPATAGEVYLDVISDAAMDLAANITDYWGKVVLEINQSLVYGFNQIKLDTSALEAGVYFVFFEGITTTVQKLIIW